MSKSTWGGPRKGAGGARRGAGRKPQSIRITVEDARAILDQNMSAGLFERLAQFVSKQKENQAMKYAYEYIEDNGGGLYLFVFNRNGRVIDGIQNLEYAGLGEWHNVKDALNKDAKKEISRWDGHMEDHSTDPQAFYNEIYSSDYGYTTVCKNGTPYPDAMGRAAARYFGIESE